MDWQDMAAKQASEAGQTYKGGALLDRFVIPPFSVLDARQGYWQERKRSWLALGIKSELGRGDDLTYRAETVRDMNFYSKKRAAERETGVVVSTADVIAEREAKRKPHRGHGRAFTQDLGKGETWNEVREKRGREAGEDSATDRMIARPIQAFEDAGAVARGLGLVPEAVDTTRRTADARANEAGNLTGAGEMPDYADFGMANVAPGTSIFDPVLCEMHYRWFAPPGGSILDPFAGGSVRGIIAAVLGHQYTGIDLAESQILANRDQATEILSAGDVPIDAMWVTDPDEPTPIERRGEVWVKRDDVFTFAGVRGGKVRTCLALARDAKAGLVTAGSRSSPQVNIVARVGRALGLPVRAHTPEGELGGEVADAIEAGAEIVQHPAGYNNVIVARARDDAFARDWTEIPFGMECAEAIRQTSNQVVDIPDEVRRIVVPVGSGMTLAAILHGLQRVGRPIAVLGIVVGADPTKRLDEYAPADWRERVELRPSGSDYGKAADDPGWSGIVLDPHYEAKAVPFLEPGDMLWVVGVRRTAVPDRLGDGLSTKPVPRWIAGDSTNIPTLIDERERFDYVFSCPPYFDLEVYSDDPRDLSAMTYQDFLVGYRAIIKAAVDRLRPGRFATFVVSEVRAGNDRGQYVGLVPDTIRAFEDAGAVFYNEAILVNAVGSLPMRVTRQFEATRKVGRMHQNVLTFLKGAIPRGWEHQRDTAPEPQMSLFAAPDVASAPIAAEPDIGVVAEIVENVGDPDGVLDQPAIAEAIATLDATITEALGEPLPIIVDEPMTEAESAATWFDVPADDEPTIDDVADMEGLGDGIGVSWDRLPDGRWVDTATGEVRDDVDSPPAGPGSPDVGVDPGPLIEPEPPMRTSESVSADLPQTGGIGPANDGRAPMRIAGPAPAQDPTSPDHCYSCGASPVGSYGDGSPRYDCAHPGPSIDPGEAESLGLGL